jgi:hypothetical protein
MHNPARRTTTDDSVNMLYMLKIAHICICKPYLSRQAIQPAPRRYNHRCHGQFVQRLVILHCHFVHAASNECINIHAPGRLLAAVKVYKNARGLLARVPVCIATAAAVSMHVAFSSAMAAVHMSMCVMMMPMFMTTGVAFRPMVGGTRVFRCLIDWNQDNSVIIISVADARAHER